MAGEKAAAGERAKVIPLHGNSGRAGAGPRRRPAPKPEAPAEYRGVFAPIRTNVKGIEVCELLPMHAKIADKFAIVRSIQHEFADHGGMSANERANQFVLESYRGGGPTADGVHLLGPLAKKVVRIAPPLVIAPYEASVAVKLLLAAAERMA